MQWLAEVCVRRPVFGAVLSLAVVALGAAAYSRLGVDKFPRIDLPVITVITRSPGSAPADVESELTEKLEAAVNTVSGIDELRSVSAEGVSLVYATFVLEKDADTAAQEVRDRVSAALPELPQGIELPVVTKLDPDASPVVYLALRAPGASERDATELADKRVRRSLESIPGVGQVRVIGGRRRQILVHLDPLRLAALGIAPGEVARAIGAQNVTFPGGRLDQGRLEPMLRVLGRVESPPELGRIVIRSGARTLRVEDVARVEDGAEEPSSTAQWSGERTVVLAIRKQSRANTVAVVDAIESRLADVQRELPPGATLELLRDDSRTIRTMTGAVVEHLVLGSLLAAVVVLLFLGNLRSTLIAAVAIPTSVVGTFALMAMKGYTLNIITLLALALSVGIVIDDAIVVLENIFKRVERDGLSPERAAIEGTREIGLAVMATTLSLVAVFLPVAFLGGIAGRMLNAFGLTMAFAIGVSLFVSFSLTPMMASRWLHAKTAGSARRSALERAVDRLYRPLEGGYLRLLAAALRHRWLVVLACAGALAAIPVLAAVVKKGFLPENDKAQFEVVVRTAEGTSVAATEVVAARLAREIRALPEVAGTLLTIGDDEERTRNIARIWVKLTDPGERDAHQDAVADRVRRDLVAKLPADVRATVQGVPEIGGGGIKAAKVEYSLTGPDLGQLERASAAVVAALRAFPGAVDVDTSLVTGKPELGIAIDRDRAADLGVQVATIAATLQLLVGGQKVSTYAEAGEQYDVRVRVAGDYRTRQEAIGLFEVPSAKGGLVPLRAVIAPREATGASSIVRLGRRRVVSLYASAAPGTGDSAVADELARLVRAQHLPPAYSLIPGGETKLMAQTASSVLFGLGLAFLFMYLVLAAQFESWLHPVTILLSLPLTLPFALLSLVLLGQGLGIFSALGIFVLFGVVKKNAILQIDHTNQLRGAGVPRHEALMRANRDRLRPILMTTIAFVAGMLPLLFSRGIGAGFNQATAGVVVGGQVLSLVLTLVATPVFYSLFDDATAWAKRRIGATR